MARQGDIHPLPMARAMAGSALTATHRPRTRGFHGAVDPRTLFLYVIVFLLGPVSYTHLTLPTIYSV